MPNCPYCNKKFGRISSLQNHSAYCAIIHQGKYAAENSEMEMDVPPIRDIYIVLQQLVKENNSLKEKIVELEKLSKREKKQICLIDWLNQNRIPTQDFKSWYIGWQVTQNDFHDVLSTNTLCGVMKILRNNLECRTGDHIPMCAFDQKLKTIFIYTNREWRIMEKGEFYKCVDSIIFKLGKQFNRWMHKNEREIIKNSEQMHLYTKKLYNMEIEELARRIHLRLYNHIKYNLKNIVEYQFSF